MRLGEANARTRHARDITGCMAVGTTGGTPPSGVASNSRRRPDSVGSVWDFLYSDSRGHAVPFVDRWDTCAGGTGRWIGYVRAPGAYAPGAYPLQRERRGGPRLRAGSNRRNHRLGADDA